MMRGYLKNKISFSLLFFVLVFFVSFSAFAQTAHSSKMIIQDGDTIVLEAISLTNITKNIEIVTKEINNITEETKPDKRIMSADSLYLVAVEKLAIESELISGIANISSRSVEDSYQQWTNYKTSLSDWQTFISERTLLLTNYKVQTENLITIWELTLEDARNEQVPEGIITNIKDVRNKLNTLKYRLKDQLLSVYSLQSKLTELTLNIDDTIKTIELEKKSLRNAYLKQDSPVLWNAYDSTFLSSMKKEVIMSSVNETGKALDIFYRANKDRFYIHILIFLILIALLHFLHKHTIKSEETDEAVIKSKKIINNYVLSALILGFIATIWVYPTRQLVVDDIFQLTLLILITLILPKVGYTKARAILFYTIGLHLVNQLQLFFPINAFVVRILLFVEIGLTFMIFRMLLDKKGILYSRINIAKWNFVLQFIKLFYLALIIPFIANIIGFVGLATLANNIIINSIFNAFIAYAGLFIAISIITLVLKSDYVSLFHSIRKYRDKILKSVIKYTTILAFFIWIKSVLMLFGVYNNIIEWLTGLFLISWEFGDGITVDLGSVLTFFIVLIVTFLLSKTISVILEEEIFTRVKLPRGVPGAISMLLKYFIIGWGIVISISALGVDLSKFGLMAGALGVGIGFGLQNIVFNFIAGLVLAFERPIQVGDTIEAGTVMGTVKSIGVRSSTVLTFDGSEVIVPNGNLISNDVVNWTLTDRRKRRDIFVGVEYGSDPHIVMEILRKAADKSINVLQDPEPWILFEGFGDSSLNFRLRIWTPMDVGLTTKSQVTMDIYDGLNEAGITIPFPQQDLHLKTIDPEVEEIITTRKVKTSTKTTKN